MAADEVRQNEDELVARAVAGDRRAFSELVEHHQDEVYTLAVRLTGDRELGADVAQEAFVRAWRALPQFRSEARFSTWMYRITANTASTHRTRALRHRAESLDQLVVEPHDRGTTPEDAAEAADLGSRLTAALAQLPPAQRMVVVLKDVYGWTHREIAEHLDVSVPATKVRLHRARSALRIQLWNEEL
jgi:RNA polymerase sigma-70 factor (ECF subfamily)